MYEKGVLVIFIFDLFIKIFLLKLLICCCRFKVWWCLFFLGVNMVLCLVLLLWSINRFVIFRNWRLSSIYFVFFCVNLLYKMWGIIVMLYLFWMVVVIVMVFGCFFRWLCWKSLLFKFWYIYLLWWVVMLIYFGLNLCKVFMVWYNFLMFVFFKGGSILKEKVVFLLLCIKLIIFIIFLFVFVIFVEVCILG